MDGYDISKGFCRYIAKKAKDMQCNFCIFSPRVIGRFFYTKVEFSNNHYGCKKNNLPTFITEYRYL